ncbi:MAG TPA: SPOR domain-containing protein [Ramlibacter sp.]|jgi:cell division protein FtsN|uniref:SPOR domain-containing protein n=1 Tax=Ramlibacter sp. TaxID=1917967 RepID=UPI002D394155|nr:SPOR domain-containing protein [Ramlibacter sp.]HZY17241.1 SPOR domain-containing protein [Ramlibacter sp.]
MNRQRGNVLVGIVIGVVIGLAAALAVAVYVTKVPVPFLSKNQGRTPEQDAAESKKNKDWDPNAPLYGRNPAKPLPPAPAVAPPGPAAAPAAPPAAPPGVVAPDKPITPANPAAPAARAPSADPLGEFAAARSAANAPEPFLYFVQTGAFRSPEDAEAQRAKLSLMGIEAKVTEREQSGRQVFRVRVGPFDKKDDAERSKERLDAGGVETALVRVQR